MVVSADIKARVNAKVLECIEKINAHYGVNIRPLNLKYDINSARLGGQAVFSTRTVRINPVFLEHHTEHYINTTIPHEVAHHGVLEVWKAKRTSFTRPSGHGVEWKTMMSRVLGVPANRCHNYTVPEGIQVGKQTRKFKYTCDKCNEVFNVGAKIHNKIQRGSIYRHNQCGKSSMLVFAGTPTPVHRMMMKAERVVLGAAAFSTKTPSPKTVPVSQRGHAGMTKFDRCLAIYMSCPGKTRAHIISKFVNEVGMTAAGASTYYSNCVKAAAK